jgi:perosamine synthetase
MIGYSNLYFGRKEASIAMKATVTGGLLKGKHNALFEKEIAEYCDAGFVKTFDSGRTALWVILKSLKARPGEEVVLPAYVCSILAEVVKDCGFKPAFVDSRHDTYNMDEEKISEKIGRKTRAVILPHLFGQPCDVRAVKEAAGKRTMLIEDNAQSLGASYAGRRTGSFGDFSILSFTHYKPINVFMGGAATAQDRAHFKEIERVSSAFGYPNSALLRRLAANISLRWFTRRKSDKPVKGTTVTYADENSISTVKKQLFPDMLAGVARTKLENLDEVLIKRRKNAEKLTSVLSKKGSINTPANVKKSRHAFTHYAVLCESEGERDAAVGYFNRSGIEAKTMYTELSGIVRGKFPVAEALTKRLFFLPCNELITQGLMERYEKVIEAW